ncbi:MAG TPA: NAD-dependent epimerase/dehydratase family protein [Nocardioidaceae bacterium]|nr:NAD-dependent epimerase/dehydratase family protein [Nocardioidaceae bacterium]
MTSNASLQVLVLGGTSWLGGAVARQALARGHQVTCLARGEAGTPPEGARWVRADRADPSAYDEVAGRPWHAVVDVSWQPAFVRTALSRLAGSAPHWVYVSSGSVYADETTPGQGEDALLHEPYDGDGPVDWDVYGPTTVACEQACLAARGAEGVLVARAGLIGGYGDRSDRLGYWPARVQLAGRDEPVLVPPRKAPVQVIDVEDLAAWLVRGAEQRVAGVFDAVGDPCTVGDVLQACVTATGAEPRLVEAADEWLTDQGVAPWMGSESLPLWLPQPAHAGLLSRRNGAARAGGLTLRPLSETVVATLAWETELGLSRARRAGLSPARESELLARLADASG